MTIKNNKGFSLIELMIAVVIIGILAAIGIPNYQKYQRKSRQAEAKSTLAAMYTSEKSYIAEYGGYNSKLSAIGYQPEGRIVYNCGWSSDSGTPPRDTNTYSDTSTNTVAACSTNCTDGTADLGAAPTLTNVAGATGGGVQDFTVVCTAQLGGSADDTWQIDAGKNLSMTSDGTIQ